MPILDLISEQRSFTEKQLMEELKKIYSHVTEDTLVPNLVFCLHKLEDAELIEKISNFYRITPKGKKILLSDTNELGLKEVNFYAAHGADYFGLPPGGLKLKNALSKGGNNSLQRYAKILAAVLMVLIAFIMAGKYFDKGTDVILNETTNKFMGEGSKEMDKSLDQLQKDLNSK